MNRFFEVFTLFKVSVLQVSGLKSLFYKSLFYY